MKRLGVGIVIAICFAALPAGSSLARTGTASGSRPKITIKRAEGYADRFEAKVYAKPLVSEHTIGSSDETGYRVVVTIALKSVGPCKRKQEKETGSPYFVCRIQTENTERSYRRSNGELAHEEVKTGHGTGGVRVERASFRKLLHPPFEVHRLRGPWRVFAYNYS